MRLKEYLHLHEITYAEMARRIGMEYSAFQKAVQAQRTLPPQYWDKIVKETRNEVDYEDLFETGKEARLFRKKKRAEKGNPNKEKE